MKTSLFNIYEKSSKYPVCLNWYACPEFITISDDEFLHTGELITIEEYREIQKNSFYVLTTKCFIKSKDGIFNNPINAEAILELSNPRLSKVDRPKLNLYDSM